MNASPIKRSVISNSRGDLIRVLAADEKGNSFSPTTFPQTEVERVMGIDEDRSALVLRSGVKIPVALPYEELEQRVYMPDFRADGPVLDLRDVTGEVAKAKPAAANANEVTTGAPAIGAQMPDGSVYAGVSPDTNKAMFVTPADAPLTYTFNEAQKYASQLDANGHQDWRVPTKAELNVLFNNRAAIGGFDISGSNSAGWYCSSSQYGTYSAWDQRFSDGAQTNFHKDDPSSLRPVR